MKLLTKAIEKKLPPLYATENTPESKKMAVVKFFHPLSSLTWYGIEYDPKERLFFGYVRNDAQPDFSEYGYFSLDELESVKVRGLGIERDMYFKPTPMSEIKAGRER